MENKRLPQLCDNKTCTGCLACVNACNKEALTMTTDKEGFYRPLFNENLCVSCGLCEKSCPVISPVKRNDENDIKVFAAWHKNETIRAKSTSGGAFSALASTILNKGGFVYGAAYTDDLHIKHIEIDAESDLDKLRLSKYAQSCTDDTFKHVKKRLVEGHLVVFVGTPCQVAGLKNFLHRDYENLLLVDFICHGVPSNDMLQAYLHWVEKKHGKVNHINFRDKRKGWYDALRVIKTEKDKDIVMRGNNDNYWVGFSINNDLQESCYNCVAQGFPRCSDITIADFWGIGRKVPFGHKNEIEKGISMIIVNNRKVMPLFEEASETLYVVERTTSEAISGNKTAIQSSHRPKSRNTIYKDLQIMDYDEFRKKYMATTLKQKAVKIFREYLPASIVKHIRLKGQK